MASQDRFLDEMAMLVRQKKTLHHLTVDDCLPYLADTYNSMSICDHETSEVPIAVILQRLQSKTDQYICDNEEVLSLQICAVLGAREIPVGLLVEVDDKTARYTVKGVILNLYRT